MRFQTALLPALALALSPAFGQPEGVETTQSRLEDGKIAFSVTNVSQQPTPPCSSPLFTQMLEAASCGGSISGATA